jgi:hypothetical protein
MVLIAVITMVCTPRNAISAVEAAGDPNRRRRVGWSIMPIKELSPADDARHVLDPDRALIRESLV